MVERTVEFKSNIDDRAEPGRVGMLIEYDMASNIHDMVLCCRFLSTSVTFFR